MAVVKYDVSGVDGRANKGREFKIPKRGVYIVLITKCANVKPKDKDRRLEIEAKIATGEYKGARYWEYINMESEDAAWKFDQFLQAMNIAGDTTKRSGSFDPAKQVDKLVKVSTFVETDKSTGDPIRSKIASWLELADDDDLDNDDEGDDNEDAGDDDDGADEDEDQGSDDDDEDEGGEIDYDSMSPGDLRAELKERGLDTKGGKSVLVTRLQESDEAGPDDDDGEGDEGDDYDEWSADDLREELKDRDLDTKGGKSVLIKRLRKDDTEGSAFDE